MRSFLSLFLFILLSLSLGCKAFAQQPTPVLASAQSISLADLKAYPNKKEGLQIITWNIQNLGRSKSDAEIAQMAAVLRHADVVAVQEVVAKDPAGAQAVARLADELNRTGAKWDYQVSLPTKSPSPYISERYAFLWKTHRIRLKRKAYLDKALQDEVYREPFIGQFEDKISAKAFYVINFHARKYNDQPEREIKTMGDYSERLNTQALILAGDFNLTERHTVWNPFYKKGFNAALNKNPTTLKRKCQDGVYRNHAIDNMFYPSGIQKIKAASIDWVGDCNRLEQARTVSDHLPVWMYFKLD